MVRIKAIINKANVKNLCFKEKSRAGAYKVSLIQFMIFSPIALKPLSLANTLAKPSLGVSSKGCKALEWAKWAGSIMSASTKDTTRVSITTTETSPKNSPILLSKNKKIEKAKTVVIIADIIGGITSRIPSIAACTGFFPRS